jgi:hypothetical protein
MGPRGRIRGNLVEAGKTSCGIVDVTMGSFVFSLWNPASEQQPEISPSTRPVGKVVQAGSRWQLLRAVVRTQLECSSLGSTPSVASRITDGLCISTVAIGERLTAGCPSLCTTSIRRRVSDTWRQRPDAMASLLVESGIPVVTKFSSHSSFARSSTG